MVPCTFFTDDIPYGFLLYICMKYRKVYALRLLIPVAVIWQDILCH